MRAEAIKGMIVRLVRETWPDTQKMSELPYPEYWRAQCEWLEFHAPRLGEAMAEQFAADIVAIALEAERRGEEPKAWIVPQTVRELWKAKPGERGEGSACASEDESGRAAWDSAAERAAAVRDRFAERRRARQGVLL